MNKYKENSELKKKMNKIYHRRYNIMCILLLTLLVFTFLLCVHILGYQTSQGKLSVLKPAENIKDIKPAEITKDKLCELDYTCHPDDGARRTDTDFEEHDFNALNKRHSSVSEGGVWKPTGCKPRAKIVIVVPYFDREKHLKIFLNNMIPFLQKQKVEFRIMVLEQKNTSALFNRALLLNAGYIEAQKLGHDSCFILHDVDYVAENWCNFYMCGEQPKHLCVISNKYKYKLFYHNFLGGCVAISNKTMTHVNGFSNIFYGWGSEDDDFSSRLTRTGYRIQRYSDHIARYRTLSHGKDKKNPPVEKRTKPTSGQFLSIDGLTTVKYTVVSKIFHKLYTNITITYDGPTNKTEASDLFSVSIAKLKDLLDKSAPKT